MVNRKQIVIICLSLTVATSIAFWRVTRCEFTTYDDPLYVTENSHVQAGMSLEGIRWAFFTGHAPYWHPLTWLSHMLDVQLFGLDPHRHHLVNLLLHIASTLMLFLVLCRITNALWQSALVAALFALHPLHVESVAWVCERKDVLSAFFWMLTMGAYAWYVRRPGLWRRLAVHLCFVLGLMAKPMLVTLPFVLLLLDYWPLRRFMQTAPRDKRKRAPKHAVTEQPVPCQWALIRPLLLEKIPLFVLAALSSVITYLVQRQVGAASSLEGLPLTVRLENAVISYVTYIGKVLWPIRLAVFYPYPRSWPSWEVIGAVLLLTAVTLTVFRVAQRFPYLAVGWLWYIGTLVPVIGLVQVGSQAMGDRFTYIPLIGLFIVVAWGVPELVKEWRYQKEVLGASSALSLACFFVLTWTQVGHWRTSITLYDHTLEVTGNNSIIHNNRGYVYNSLGDHRQAIEDFDRAIEIDPRCAEAYNNRGIAYSSLGDYLRAIADYGRAIQIDPKYAVAYVNRGNAYNGLGDYRRAIEDYDRAIEINQTYAQTYYDRGVAYYGLGNYSRAIEDYTRAIDVNPRYAEAFDNRGVANNALGNRNQAIKDLTTAIEINPRYAEAYNNRGGVYNGLGNHRQAIEDCDKAIRINPNYAEAYVNRGNAYNGLGDYERAIEDLKTAALFGHEGARNFLKSQGITW